MFASRCDWTYIMYYYVLHGPLLSKMKKLKDEEKITEIQKTEVILFVCIFF